MISGIIVLTILTVLILMTALIPKTDHGASSIPSSDDESISLDSLSIDDSICELTFDDDSLTDVVSSVNSLD